MAVTPGRESMGREAFEAILGPLARYLTHTTFTKVQARGIPLLFKQDENVLVAAPTGSGKTVLLEVAMLRLFRERLCVRDDYSPQQSSTRVGTPEARKAVYVCPIKALAAEKFAAWSTMFAPLTVAIETGDQEWALSDALNLQSVTTADIIITTPERWDSITRRWKERTVFDLVNSVGLVLLDEVHTLSEERGAVLEALVSRMKAVTSARSHSNRAATSATADNARAPLHPVHRVRFVAVSGTLPNIHDVGEWLDVLPAMRLSFSDADRPVPLTTNVLGFPNDSRNPFVFDRFLTFKLFSLIRQFAEGKPAIVFCASRKESVTAAQHIVEDVRQAAAKSGQANLLEPSTVLKERVQAVNDKQLRACLLVGIAFHHAALSLHDRQLVEQLFRDQFISAVCTTTTLALGVNLPAHLVIVKGTTFFKAGSREDTPLSEVAQMCGRAGRPGLDTHGIALILTTDDRVAKYDQLRNGDAFTTIESQLHQHMIEHVNAEVALRTIHSFESAVSWVKTTFFWIRLRRNPGHYGLQFRTEAEASTFDADAFVAELVRGVLVALQEEGCVTGVPPCEERLEAKTETLSRLETTSVGRAMSRLYILFDTVKTYNAYVRQRRGTEARHCRQKECSAPPGEGHDGNDTVVASRAVTVSDDAAGQISGPPQKQCQLTVSAPRFQVSDVLTLLAQSRELSEVRLRQGDRGHLNELNKAIRYPLKSGKRGGREVREDWQKAFVLIQAPLSQLPVNDVSLRNDSIRLWSVLPRVLRFLTEYAWLNLSYSFALHADMLSRCVDNRVWPDGLVLRQLPAVTEAVACTLAKAGLRQLHSLDDLDARRLEVLCGKLPPFGSQLKAQARALPVPSVTIEEGGESMRTSSALPRSGAPVAGPQQFRIKIDLTHTVPQCNTRDTDSATGTAANSKRGKGKVVARHGQGRLLLLVGHRATDAILLRRYVTLPETPAEPLDLSVTFDCQIPCTMPAHTVTIHVITPDVVGNDVVVSLQPEPRDSPTAANPSHAPPTMGEDKPRLRGKRVMSGATATPRARAETDTEAATGGLAETNADSEAGRPASPAAVKEASTSPTFTEVAAEAHASFNALLSDLHYVTSDAPPRRERKKRTRSAASTMEPVSDSGAAVPSAHCLPAPFAPPRPEVPAVAVDTTAQMRTVPAAGVVGGPSRSHPASTRHSGWPCATLPPPPRLDASAVLSRTASSGGGQCQCTQWTPGPPATTFCPPRQPAPLATRGELGPASPPVSQPQSVARRFQFGVGPPPSPSEACGRARSTGDYHPLAFSAGCMPGSGTPYSLQAAPPSHEDSRHAAHWSAHIASSSYAALQHDARESFRPRYERDVWGTLSNEGRLMASQPSWGGHSIASAASPVMWQRPSFTTTVDNRGYWTSPPCQAVTFSPQLPVRAAATRGWTRNTAPSYRTPHQCQPPSRDESHRPAHNTAIPKSWW